RTASTAPGNRCWARRCRRRRPGRSSITSSIGRCEREPMTALLTHPHWPVPIQVKRSERARRMSLKVDPTQRMATLVLPTRVSERVAMAFIADHIGWLQRRLDALPAPIPFAPGMEIPLLGEPHRLHPAPGARRGVWIEDGGIHVSGPPDFFARRVGD